METVTAPFPPPSSSSTFIAWENDTSFSSGEVVVTVNVRRFTIPEYSFRIGTTFPDGTYKGNFIQYKNGFNYEKYLQDVMTVCTQAHEYILQQISCAKKKAAEEEEAAEKARAAQALKDKEEAARKEQKKDRYLKNKEQRREENRNSRNKKSGK